MHGSPKTINIEQIHALLDALLCHAGTKKQFRRGIRNYTMACIMLEAGLRVGEIVQLRKSDLWFNSRPVMSIIIRPEIAKNKKEREIPVSTKLSDAITQMYNSYWCNDTQFNYHFAFWQNNSSIPLTTRQVERVITATAEKAIGRPVNPHMLRHTFADRLRKVTDLRTVQELLGHSRITSTQIYTHPNGEDKRNAINGLERQHSESYESALVSAGSKAVADGSDT